MLDIVESYLCKDCGEIVSEVSDKYTCKYCSVYDERIGEY